MKSRLLNQILMFGLLCGIASAARAEDQPRVGRDAAAKYFQRRAPTEASPRGPSDHYLALYVGKFMNGQAWNWGQHEREDGAGGFTAGLTYRIDQWASSMDYGIRIDFSEYNVVGEKPLKMTLMPVLTFPDAASRFPLYFGAGLGLGIFFKQVPDESPLTIEDQLFAGARFLDLADNLGFFIESGLKNHLQITTDGQFNGVFLTGGAVFSF